ncbi:MAG: hypothetical protein AB1442_13480, partial [Nitrospirota bacterium]
MKRKIKYIVLGLLLMAIFTLAMMKSPEEIAAMLSNVTSELTAFSVFVHVIFLAVMATGLMLKKTRNFMFFSFIAFLSLSATAVSIKYIIIPNIIIFATIFALIMIAYFRKELNFNFEDITPVNKYVGIAGLVFGFWYLHWVESPIWLNAFLYSPLGSVNCPTLLTISAFPCLTAKPRSVLLESMVAIITPYFGFLAS